MEKDITVLPGVGMADLTPEEYSELKKLKDAVETYKNQAEMAANLADEYSGNSANSSMIAVNARDEINGMMSVLHEDATSTANYALAARSYMESARTHDENARSSELSAENHARASKNSEDQANIFRTEAERSKREAAYTTAEALMYSENASRFASSAEESAERAGDYASSAQASASMAEDIVGECITRSDVLPIATVGTKIATIGGKSIYAPAGGSGGGGGKYIFTMDGNALVIYEEEDGIAREIFRANVGGLTRAQVQQMLSDYAKDADVQVLYGAVSGKADSVHSHEIADIYVRNGETEKPLGGLLEEAFNGIAEQIPTELPNPNALTINGTSYDGSQPVEMTISGGGGGEEEWETITDVTLSDSSIVGINLGHVVYEKWKKIRLFMKIPKVDAVINTALGFKKSATGSIISTVCNSNSGAIAKFNAGNTSGAWELFNYIDFSVLSENFPTQCPNKYLEIHSMAQSIGYSPMNSINIIHNSYDWGSRFIGAKYIGTDAAMPAGTQIIIEGVEK